MVIVRESISFERGRDPKETMGVGLRSEATELFKLERGNRNDG